MISYLTVGMIEIIFVGFGLLFIRINSSRGPDLSLIPMPEGKKVYTKDGVLIGEIVQAYISEFGVHVAKIKTVFKEFPEFEVVMTQLKPTRIALGGKQEEAYILKEIPIKLQMIIDEKLKAQVAGAAKGVTVIFTPNAPTPVGPYSQAIKAGKFLFVAGQIPIDPKTGRVVEGGIKEQTIRVLKNIKAILEAAGYTLNDVVMVFVYMNDLAKFGEFNEVYAQYFSGAKPARVTVEVSRLPKDVMLEISVIAYRE